jgi:hypothetical protein
MKNKKLLALVGTCVVLAFGATFAVSVATKSEAKADEIVKEDKGTTKGLTDYFRKIKMSECDIQIEGTEFQWSGQVITPKVTVTYGGETLIINKDYKLKYSDNTDAGPATVKVKGIGDYRGSKKLAFYIKGIDFATDCTYEYVNDRVVVYHNGEVVDEREYNVESYYYDTFMSDNGIETTYVRTTVYNLYGKGRYEGVYEFVTEKQYKVNNETGESTLDVK